MPANNDISVSVIGGYLGSGKTTLINHILATADERTAVLVNDFGDINIDASLIESSDDTTLTLANGCICCSLADGFVSALIAVAALVPRPARLVIEASGVADPATVAAYAHGPGFVLDAVVVMIDAETVRTQAADPYVGDTVLGHLDAADIAVVNKSDLVSAAVLDETVAWVDERCHNALIHVTTGAVIDPALLFGFSPSSLDPGSTHPPANHRFRSWSWQLADAPTTRTTITQLMDETDASVVRAKGIVWLDDDADYQYVLQRVGGRWSLRRGRPWPTGQQRSSAVVFIAVNAEINPG